MDFEYSYRNPETSEVDIMRNSLSEELEKISARERRIALAFENGIDSLEEYAENKKRLKTAREELQKQLLELNSSSDKNKKPSREYALSKVRTVYEIIKDPDVDYEKKGMVMRSLVDRIVYDKANNNLEFYIYIS